jgi:hypothetical protein
VHSAQCAMMRGALPCTRARNGTALPGMYLVRGGPHRQLEGKAIGLRVRETDDLPATVGWRVQVRHSQFAHLHSSLHACRNLVHSALILYQASRISYETITE